MNKKTFLLILVISGLIFSALIFKNGDLLIIAIPPLVYLIIGVILIPADLALVANRTLDKTSAFPQEIVKTSVVITNQGKTILNLYLNDSLNQSLAVDSGRTHQRLTLEGGGTTELEYSFTAARGDYAWLGIKAVASDPFGLFEVTREIPAGGELLVYPAPLNIRQLSLKPHSTIHTSGPIPALLAGSGTDFWGVREYRQGDPLRRINWRLAARYPKELFTNEYQMEEIGDFGIILDARRLSSASVSNDKLFEYSVSAAASLSENIIKNGNRVSLLVFGETLQSVFPGLGKIQRNMILKNLAIAKSGKNIPFSYLEYFSTRLFPAHSMIIIVSQVESDDFETYARLRGHGYDVLLITPDPVEFVSRDIRRTDINILAIRAARIERIVQLKRLSKIGVKVVDWQVNQPLNKFLHSAVGQFPHRRNFSVIL